MTACIHPARFLQNPRLAPMLGGPERVWVADCAPARGGCGWIIVLDPEIAQDARQDSADMPHGGPLGPESVSDMDHTVARP